MELLNSSEVAALLRVSSATVRYYRATGTGPPWFKLGPSAVRYRKDAVEKWIAERELERGAVGQSA